MRRLLLLLLTLVTLGCGPSVDLQCGNPAKQVFLPNPLWQTESGLQLPENDRALAILGEYRPDWIEQLGGASGWPRLPNIIVPLSKDTETVDAAGIHFQGRGEAGDWSEATLDFSTETNARHLILNLQQPFPAHWEQVRVLFDAGAFGDARPLAPCTDDKAPQAFVDAMLELDSSDGVDLVLPFALSQESKVLPKLASSYAAAPPPLTPSAALVDLSSFAPYAPDAPTAATLAPQALAGTLDLPDFRDSRGYWSLGSDGLPVEADRTEPGFLLVFPSNWDGVSALSLVIFQHGGGQDKRNLLSFVAPMAEAGFAVLGMDLPFHGDRAPAGGGSDMDILDFDVPLITRDNLRQASADHIALLSNIDAINQTLSDLGDPHQLITDPVFYMGLSLGGITGSMSFASSPNLAAAGLFVAAGKYPLILSEGLFSLLVNDLISLVPLERATVFGLLELLLDGADPAAYGQAAEDRSLAPKPALFFQAIGDTIVSREANDLWARAFGASLAQPSQHPVTGMDSVALPAQDTFSWEGGSAAATRLQIQCPMDEIPAGDRHGALIEQVYSQEAVAHCFTTWRNTGSCQLLDTGWANH